MSNSPALYKVAGMAAFTDIDPRSLFMPIDRISGDSLASSLIALPNIFPDVLIISAGNAMKFPNGNLLNCLIASGTLA